MTPTERSLAFFRDQGRTVAVVEKFVRFPPPGHRVDLFGVIDILAIGGGVVIGCQTTSGSNAAARVAKILASPHFETMRTSGIKLVVHAWRKVGPRGKRKTWEVKETWLS